MKEQWPVLARQRKEGRERAETEDAPGQENGRASGLKDLKAL